MSVNTIPLVPMFDFSKIPGAIKITGAEKITFDEMLEIEKPGHPIYVAPDLPFYISHTVINIPAINFEDLINLLEGILSNIEKIEVTKINFFVYKIEFHPIDGIKIYPKEKIHRLKWWSSMHAATAALKKFPELGPNFDDDFMPPFIPPPPAFRDEWFKMELRIYYSTKKECYMLEFNRLSGEAFSFYKIYRQIEAQIQSIFSESNVRWLMRKNYINLFEGTKEICSEDKKQISRYLLNDLLMREICTFIGVAEEIVK